jgi:26S proteasome regulatory subunit N2
VWVTSLAYFCYRGKSEPRYPWPIIFPLDDGFLFWYWYPLAHCACLSFLPTGIIGLNGDLKVISHYHVFYLGLILCSQAPKFEYVSNAKPGIFAYPASIVKQLKETVAKVATAVLSMTAKVKAREKKKAAAEDLVRY